MVVQRQVMTTLGRLQKETGASVILVGHDMGLVAQFADKVGVMYAGKLVELSPVYQIVNEPLHPYSDLLLKSVPGLDEKAGTADRHSGYAAAAHRPAAGCLFAPRCPSAMAHCSQVTPELEPIDDGVWWHVTSILKRQRQNPSWRLTRECDPGASQRIEDLWRRQIQQTAHGGGRGRHLLHPVGYAHHDRRRRRERQRQDDALTPAPGRDQTE